MLSPLPFVSGSSCYFSLFIFPLVGTIPKSKQRCCPPNLYLHTIRVFCRSDIVLSFTLSLSLLRSCSLSALSLENRSIGSDFEIKSVGLTIFVRRFKMAMRGYDRDEYEDLDEYEEEGLDDEEEEVGEDEHEEEEAPTEEQLEYLELRQRLKESIRKQMKKGSGSALNSGEKKNKLPYDNYGYFFGPSQPVIAQRVIQESKSLLENPHLAERVSKSNDSNNKVRASAPSGSRPRVNGHPPRVSNGIKPKTKIQILKNTRDYSFLLSDDAELPASIKDPRPRNVPAPKPEARLAQVPLKSKQLLSNNGKRVLNGREERKAVPRSSQLQPNVRPHKLASASKPMTSADSRKQFGSNNGSGTGRPQGPKGLPSKVPTATTEKKPPMLVVRKPLPSNLKSSFPKQPLDRRRELQESSKGKLLSKQPVSSKPQIKQPPAKVPARVTLQEKHPKKRPARQYSDEEEDGGKAISMIRRMFGYNPRKYAAADDDSDMEANFDDILKEERRSAKIAKKEDEEELRKIEEDERRERLRKEAKKRKLS